MSIVRSLLLFLSAVVCLAFVVAGDGDEIPKTFNRTAFPANFIFGTASSAYQYEGAADEGGRGPSIWDSFTQKYPDKIKDGSNGKLGVNSYYRYSEDVGLMKDVGFNGYRFSISWPRILPNGKLSGGVNQEGIAYYNNLINELLSNGGNVQFGQSLYMSQKGKVGISIVALGLSSISSSPSDHDALKRATDFSYGWFMDPLVFGHYPETMVSMVGERLPKFSAEESLLVKGSFDFLGLNYYMGFFAIDVPCSFHGLASSLVLLADSCVHLSGVWEGKEIGPLGAVDYFRFYPKGLHDILVYTKEKYNNPVIYITESGVNEVDTGEVFLQDFMRIDYFKSHLWSAKTAIDDKVDLRGFFAWSLMDNFEWAEGYTSRFGLHYVDFKGGFKVYPKLSAKWFKEFLQIALA
ncbi:Glycoside hydrolase family 1 [Dillenia turbinata]|uniref:Glycoside hydrolase family 1 n=1 Tax=Dillenia turbinata TaxID=194707 RepID=A0AAN8VL44_9MAGN